MKRREASILFGVVAALTAGLTAWTYYYSPSATVFDLTVELDEGLLVVNLPLVPIAHGEAPRTRFLLYHRGANAWQAGEGGRMPWRKLPMVEAFADNSCLVAGFGYWLGGWQSSARPGPFLVLLTPLWALAGVGSLAYVALRTRRVRLRLWMLFAATALVAVALAWLTRRASG